MRERTIPRGVPSPFLRLAVAATLVAFGLSAACSDPQSQGAPVTIVASGGTSGAPAGSGGARSSSPSTGGIPGSAVPPPEPATPTPPANGGCPAGKALCAGACVFLRGDDASGGACDTACTAPLSRREGACVCPLGFDASGTSCVEIARGAAHCGGCDQSCGPSQACLG